MLRAAAVAVFALLVAAAPAGAQAPRDWLGVVADGPLTDPAADREREWDLVGRSGAATIRTAFYWWDGQPAGPGAVDFSAYDRVVLAAARRGLRTLPIVHGTPAWARSRPGDAASPPRDPADFGRFLRALVGRYGPRGSLWRERRGVRRLPIRDWQVWNEPNLTRYWSRQPFARSYVKLLEAAHGALAAADPGARVVLAGLPNESWTALRKVYKAGGKRYFDAVALHPYTGKPRDVVRLAELARKEM